MFNPLNLITKLIKSSNQKEIDRLQKITQKINSLEENTKKLKDNEFPDKTREFKNKLKNGIQINELLPEAFALGEQRMLYRIRV